MRKLYSWIKEVITVIYFIQLGNDLLPNAIKWFDFIVYLLDWFGKIRDMIFYPLMYLFSWINLPFPPWVRTYLLLGFIFYFTYNTSYLRICGHPSKTSITGLIIYDEKINNMKMILSRILLWPMSILELIDHYYKKRYTNEINVTTEWGKYVIRSLLFAVIIAFINYLINDVINY